MKQMNVNAVTEIKTQNKEKKETLQCIFEIDA